MSRFELSKKALDDLIRIAKYTESRWGRTQRDLYIKQLDESFHFLAKTPLAGKSCDHLKTGCRQFLQGRHIVFYIEAAKNTITIVRILHQSMDVESRVSDS